MNEAPLKLSATDEEDLRIIAAVLQDAIAPVCDMIYLPGEKRFVMVAHRFKWDEAEKTGASRPPCYERVHCALEIEGVEGVQKLCFDEAAKCGMLDLLTLLPEEGCLNLVFAGGAQIKLKLGTWRLRIEDFGEPWPTTHQPCHPA
ncbi:MAG: DUF2948 family protein [Alphaproteobacteria bacterium]|nr:DUF2948 family protein [Alphaproteobacteria bacterium]